MNCEIKNCGKLLVKYEPFDVQVTDEKGNSFIQHYGYGYRCPNPKHFHKRKPTGY